MKKISRLDAKGIISIIEKNKAIISKYKVNKIGLFGSYLKGKQNKISDIDFLVSFKEPTFDNYMELKFALERLFKKKVDLIIEDTLKPALRYVKGETIYAKRV